MLYSSGYSLIKYVEIIFRPYYFVKQQKEHLAKPYCSVLFFLIEGNLLCCTKMKMTSLNECNKPPAFKSIHHYVEMIPSKYSKRISSMATILGVHLVVHNDSSLVTLLPISCYLTEEGMLYFGGKSN